MALLEFFVLLFNRYVFNIIDALGRIFGIPVPFF